MTLAAALRPVPRAVAAPRVPLRAAGLAGRADFAALAVLLAGLFAAPDPFLALLTPLAASFRPPAALVTERPRAGARLATALAAFALPDLSLRALALPALGLLTLGLPALDVLAGFALAFGAGFAFAALALLALLALDWAGAALVEAGLAEGDLAEADLAAALRRALAGLALPFSASSTR